MSNASPAGGPHIFCFGIGTDVNTHLLDRIASATHSASQYVLPEEDIEVKVSNFYEKIKEPALTNVTMSVTGGNIHVSQIFPSTMSDIFKGQMLVAFGKYSGDGPASVKVTGYSNGERREFVQDVNFTANDQKNAFIPQLWATRRVGWLLDEIRMHGESAELKDEVVQLARTYGIVTPYTAYLIMEDEHRRNVPLSLQSYRELNDDSATRDKTEAYYKSAPVEAASEAARSGKQAVANAQGMDQLKDSENAQQAQLAAPLGKPVTGGFNGSVATSAPAGYRVTTNYAQQVRLINGRAFYQNGNIWTDNLAQSTAASQPIQVQFNSEPYFALLKKHPEAMAWLSLGTDVDVVLDGQLMQIRAQ